MSQFTPESNRGKNYDEPAAVSALREVARIIGRLAAREAVIRDSLASPTLGIEDRNHEKNSDRSS